MAENLRFNAPGSVVNPDNPMPEFGRLYNGISAQTACPEGWHLPSDAEWNEMEMFLGMPAADTAKIFWRGKHGTKLKSVIGWDEGFGTNSSGFNAYPAGFYDPGYFNGLGLSVGFWSSTKGDRAWVRFLGAPKEGVNRFDDNIYKGGLVSCRCVKS